MNRVEAAALLTIAASYDGRDVTEADATAWAAALPEVGFEDAREATVAHYRDETAWLKPAHVLQRVRRARGKRLAVVALPVPPSSLADDPRLEAQWTRLARNGLAAGMTEAEAVADACRMVGVEPDGAIGPADPGRLRAIMAAARVGDDG